MLHWITQMSSRVSTEPVSLPRNGSAMDFISVNSYSLAFVSAQITKVWYHKAQVSGNQWFQVDQKIVDLKVYSILRQQGKYISNVCDNIVVRSVPSVVVQHCCPLRNVFVCPMVLKYSSLKFLLVCTMLLYLYSSLQSRSGTPLTPCELCTKHGRAKSTGLGVGGPGALAFNGCYGRELTSKERALFWLMVCRFQFSVAIFLPSDLWYSNSS